MQTDPIGYEDQINLYAYVGNDPMTNVDPSGMKCVGSGDKSECTIDKAKIDGKWMTLDKKGRQDLSKNDPNMMKAINKLEGSITAAYKQAQAVGNNTVTLEGNSHLQIPDMKISGKELAGALASATELNYRHSPFWKREKGNAITDRPAGTILFKRKTLYNPPSLQIRTALHEGIHLLKKTNAWDSYRNQHQEPFTKAAEEMRDF